MKPVDPYDLLATEIPPRDALAIRAFWAHFGGQADGLDRAFSKGDPAEATAVMTALAEVHPDLMWEFGPSDRGHALCITAEWRHGLRALARAAVAAAPDLPRWRFHDARAALGGHWSTAHFEARAQGPLVIGTMRAVAGSDNKVGLEASGTGDQVVGQALLLASLLLGEAADRDWLGQVTVVPGPGLLGRLTGRRAVFDAQAFLAGFAAQVAAVRDGLPGPLALRDPEAEPVTLLTIKPMPEGSARGDLMTFSTSSRAYADAALFGPGFASCNHSRHGEWFAFLRIPHEGQPGLGTDVTARAVVETALHAALSRAGIGGLIAAGHGSEAVYLDFGMTDLVAGLKALAAVFADQPWAALATVHFLEAGLQRHPLALTAPLRAQQ